MTVTIEIGDTEYVLEVSHFERAVEPSGWDPGAGGEVELEETVKVWGMVESSRAPYGRIPGVVKRIPLSEFIGLYAEYHAVPDLKAAEENLLAEVYDDVVRQHDEDFDDREPDE